MEQHAGAHAWAVVTDNKTLSLHNTFKDSKILKILK
jgi:hypothetical protein